MVKAVDRMRWGFAPARVRFPPYLKCKNHQYAPSRPNMHMYMCEIPCGREGTNPYKCAGNRMRTSMKSPKLERRGV